MRFYKFIFLNTTLGLLLSCSPKVVPSSNEGMNKDMPESAAVNHPDEVQSGTIMVKSDGFGEDYNSAVSDAQKNAFSDILFRGIPGTLYNLPLVANENEAWSNNEQYLDSFFNKGQYQKFMLSSTEGSDLIKVEDGNMISLNIKVNYNSLRRDLEQNNIIRKFGY